MCGIRWAPHWTFLMSSVGLVFSDWCCGAFLIVIWSAEFIPTQDGPTHLATALVLKNYGKEGTRFEDFYYISRQLLPNWTCFAMLAGLSFAFSPLVAEKTLVTVYLIGFAWSCRYFLGAFDVRAQWLALPAFLLACNTCFWFGFYNYCLSVVLYLFTVGYILRRWNNFTYRAAFFLWMILCLTFFTHLVGFVLEVATCLWIAITIPPWHPRKLLLILAAVVPGCALSLNFFYERTSSKRRALGNWEPICWHGPQIRTNGKKSSMM